MKSFDHFELCDFLEDESFRSWVLERASPLVVYWWERFPVMFPEKAALMIQAKETLLAIHADMFTPDPASIQQNIRHIMRDTEPAARSVVPFWSYQRITWAATIVTSLVIILTAWFGWYRSWDKSTAVYSQMVATATLPLKEVVNTSSKTLLVLLADGRSVLLKPNSRISYPREFTRQSKREVYLVGEAFFEVAKNPDKPFFVYADNMITKALGTSFTVRAYEKKAVNVTVKTGRVSVFARSDKE